MKHLNKPALPPLLLALLSATAAAPAAAAAKTWLCADGVYTSAACWSPRGIPVYPDALQVGPVGDADTLLRYNAGTHNVASLLIDAPDFRPGQPGAVRVEFSGGRFSVLGALVVADRGRASLELLSGAVLSGQTLMLGLQAGASGALTMNGGSVGANSVLVGGAGAGQIDLAAGTLSTSTFKVWSGSGGSVLNLSAGLLAASTSVSVGGASGQYGLVDQAGGLLRAPLLSVGDGGAGAYVLRGSGELAAAQQRVGVGGEGLIQQQDAGSRNTATQLVVGVTRSASYELLGGELVATSTWVGQGASGRFVTDGGTHRVGDLQIGTDPRAGGGYQLSKGLLAAVSVRVGAVGAVGTFVHNGGIHQVDDAMEIAAGSSYLLQGSGVLALGANVVALNLGSFEHQNGARFVGTLDNAGSFVFGSSGSVTGLPLFDGRLINRGSITLRVNGSFADGLRNEGVFSSLVAGRALALDGAGLDNAGTLLLRGGVLQGNGALRNSALVSGHGRIGGSAGFVNDGLVQQDGGALLLSNAQGALNRGRWVGQARQALQLEGAGVSFNNQGQLALADGWVNGSGVLINGAAGTVTGSGTVNTRLINHGSLVLGAADQLTVNGPFTNTGLIDLGAASAMLAGNVLSNSGLVAGRGRIANAVNNAAGGRIQADGGVLAFGGLISNQGLLVAGPGGTLLLQGGLAQQGRLQLEGGTLDLAGSDLVNQGVIGGFGSLRGTELVNQRQILLSGGASQLQANLDQQAGAQVIVSGGAVATFHGTLRARAGSELRVSEDSGAVFFAAVSQENGAAFTGSGTRWFEGGLSVGDSPGDGGVGGDAVFGDHNLYRAEIGGLLPGSGHDRFSAAGHLQLGGDLQLSWWGGFSPQAGQRFDLFDWASSSGQFRHIDYAAAPLADGLRWDASRLFLDGSLAVAAVPEPGAWLLMAGGLVGLICRRRQMRFQARRADRSATNFTGSQS